MPRMKKETKTAFGSKRRSKPRGRQGGRKALLTTVNPAGNSISQPGPSGFIVSENLTEQASTSDPFVSINESSASYRKTNYFQEMDITDANICKGYRIISFEALERLIESLACPKCKQQELQLQERYEGMVSHFSPFCRCCESKVIEVNSSEYNEPNLASNIGLLTVATAINYGIGHTKLCDFFSGLNLPKPFTVSSFQILCSKVQNVIEIAAEEHFKSVVSIVKEEYEKIGKDNNDNILNIAVSYDGTWHKRGHSSLFGVGAVIDILTGLVIDVKVMSKYCQGCTLAKSYPDKYRDHQCQINYEGSSAGMEVEAAIQLFQESEKKHGLRYVTILSDGDSKAYLKLKEKNIYGSSFPISKEECVNHVAKRMGYALRKLKESSKQSGTNLGGRGRLTNEKIAKIQNYYGRALKDNAPDVEAMRNAAYASLFHMISTDQEPHHTFCPKGAQSWCHYNRSLHDPSQKKPHKPTLTKDIGEALLPIYKRLTDQELLKRCTRNKTQNSNESFHSLIWQKCPKGMFASLKTVKTATLLAAVQFNKGPVSFLDLVTKLDIPIGMHQKEAADNKLKRKLSDAARLSSSKVKIERKMRKTKRVKLDNDPSLYEPGAF